jgi:hypothetical protein
VSVALVENFIRSWGLEPLLTSGVGTDADKNWQQKGSLLFSFLLLYSIGIATT